MNDEKKVMRINNKRIIPLIETYYTVLFVGLFITVLLIIIPVSAVNHIISPYFLFVGFAALIFVFNKFGHQHFEYNSDGEVLNIKTQDPFWVRYFPNSKNMVDFPKQKLLRYKVKNMIFKKTLELYVTSKRTSNGMAKLKFNLTYLKNSEIADLKRSLSKVVKHNQENQIEEEDK